MPHCPSYEEMHELEEACTIRKDDHDTLLIGLTKEQATLVRAIIVDNRQMRKRLAEYKRFDEIRGQPHKGSGT